MKQVVLQIEEGKYQFFMELIRSLSFVEVKASDDEPEDSKEEILENLAKGFNDLNLYKQGKLKTFPAKEFLNEL
jgi:hypothetical protein